MKNNYKEFTEKMDKSMEFLDEELKGLRAGRASASLVEKIHVDYYGVSTPLNQVGNVSVPEPRTLTIQPWDVSLLSEIEKAILKSDLGINPTNDGKLIRLSFPPLTEERRKEITKTVHKKGEEAKVAIRAIRREALDHFKKQEKKSEITEDDLKDIEKDIQELTDKYCNDIDEMVKIKEKEILEV